MSNDYSPVLDRPHIFSTETGSGRLKTFRHNTAGLHTLFWLSDQKEQSKLLGSFSSAALAEARCERFILQPETTPQLALDESEATRLKAADTSLNRVPAFIGVFGTAFSGYVLKPDGPDTEGTAGPEAKVMLFYTADYRSELLGVWDEVTATERLTEHYDARRQRCLLC